MLFWANTVWIMCIELCYYMVAGNSSFVRHVNVGESGGASMGSPVAVDEWWINGGVTIWWAIPYAHLYWTLVEQR